jgi:hypothetical protein
MASHPLNPRRLSHRRSSERSQAASINPQDDLVVNIDNPERRFPNSLEIPRSPNLNIDCSANRFPNSLDIPQSPNMAESPRSILSSPLSDTKNVNVEEDVCYPMRPVKHANSFDLNAVNDHEKTKLELAGFGNPLGDSDPLMSPIKKMDSHQSKNRKYSLYGDNAPRVKHLCSCFLMV